MDLCSGQTYQMCELEQLHPPILPQILMEHPPWDTAENTPCPQVANSPVKERKANDCSAQWETMGASGTMRRTSS